MKAQPKYDGINVEGWKLIAMVSDRDGNVWGIATWPTSDRAAFRAAMDEVNPIEELNDTFGCNLPLDMPITISVPLPFKPFGK